MSIRSSSATRPTWFDNLTAIFYFISLPPPYHCTKLFSSPRPGTSISFGFKKKINSSANKKHQQQQLANGNRGNDRADSKTATIISNHNVIKAEQNQHLIAAGQRGESESRDDNGNNSAGKILSSIFDKKSRSEEEIRVDRHIVIM